MTPFSFGFPDILIKENKTSSKVEKEYASNKYFELIKLSKELKEKLFIYPITKIIKKIYGLKYYIEYDKTFEILKIEGVSFSKEVNSFKAKISNHEYNFETKDYIYKKCLVHNMEEISHKNKEKIDLVLNKSFHVKRRCYNVYNNITRKNHLSKLNKYESIVMLNTNMFIFETLNYHCEFNFKSNIISCSRR